MVVRKRFAPFISFGPGLDWRLDLSFALSSVPWSIDIPFPLLTFTSMSVLLFRLDYAVLYISTIKQ